MTLSLLKIFKRRAVWLSLICLVVLLIGILQVTKRRPPPAPVVVAPTVSTLEFLPTDIATVATDTVRQVLPLSGALRALNQVAVKAKVNGEVKEVLVRAGEAVSAGQVLIKIDPTEYQAKLDQAKGALLAARGQLDIATKTRDNNQVLLEKSFISRNAFDNAASQYDIAKANVDSARGALDVAQKALTDSVVRAPISGLISSRTVEPGEKVSTDNKLLEVVDLQQMELEAPVPTADILKVQLGQEVQVRVEGLPQTVTGKVVRINPSTQTGSRSIMVYVRIDNRQGLLRSGMFADASLTLERHDAVLTVPQTAIRIEEGKSYVYTIENNKLMQRPVVTGLRGLDSKGDAVEISSGLQSGIRVVKTNLGNLSSGTAVRVMPGTDKNADKNANRNASNSANSANSPIGTKE